MAEEAFIKNVNINLPAVKRRIAELPGRRCVKKEYQVRFIFIIISVFHFFHSNQLAWLLRAVTCIDLTTLSGDDTASNVERLCHKASQPILKDWLEAIDMQDYGETCCNGAVVVNKNKIWKIYK